MGYVLWVCSSDFEDHRPPAATGWDGPVLLRQAAARARLTVLTGPSGHQTKAGQALCRVVVDARGAACVVPSAALFHEDRVSFWVGFEPLQE